MIIPQADLEARIEAYKIMKIRHFVPEEFFCKCGDDRCDDQGMDLDYVKLLDEFRDYTGVPMRITSGYRCMYHPIEIKKEHLGPHTTGKASDSAIVGAALNEMLYELGWFESNKGPELGRFTGIGMNQKGDHDKRFLHLDTCDSAPWRPRPHVWTY